MGTPSPKLLRHLIGSTKANSLKYNFPQKDGCGIRSLISTSSDSCIDLINLLLRYDPDDRYTSKEALRHSFFDGVQLPESIKQQVATIKHQKQNIENVLKIKSDAQTLSNNNATLSNTNISKYDTSNSNLTKTETQIMKAVSYKNISEESKYIPVDTRQYPVEKEQMKKVIKAYAPGPQELKLPRLTFQTNQYDNMGNIKTNTRQDLLPIGHQRRLRRHEEKKIQSSYNSSSTNWNSGFGVVGKAPVGSTKVFFL